MVRGAHMISTFRVFGLIMAGSSSALPQKIRKTLQVNRSKLEDNTTKTRFWDIFEMSRGPRGKPFGSITKQIANQ